MAEVSTAIAAGFFALSGVLIGGFLSYITAKKINERRAKEARRTRALAQLERINLLAESLQSHFHSVLVAVHATVNSGEVKNIGEDEKWSIAELEFLVRVYLPKAKLYFYEMHSLERKMREMLLECYTASLRQLDNRLMLTESNELNSRFMDSIEHLREEIVGSARELESA